MKHRMCLNCLIMLILLILASCAAEENSGDEPVYSPVSADISTADNETELQTESDAEEEYVPDATETPIFGNETPSLTERDQDVDEAEMKTLIAYFSLIDIVPEGADASTHATPAIGNTQSAAMEIQRQTGGDLFAIQTLQSYPVMHRECSVIAEEEMRSDARPELSTHVENMDGYDTVYIGYPIWWYIEPMAIRTFLEEYDFSGKTIIPFCTTMGVGIAESQENIATLVENATVLEGITLRTGREDINENIASWLTDIGMSN